MKNPTFKLVLLFGLFVLFSAACTSAPIEMQEPSAKTAPDKAAPTGIQEGWPREAKIGAVNFKVYQPQLESWDGVLLQAYAAIEVTVASTEGASYGAALISARTEVDKVNRMVTLDDLKIVKVLFPATPDREPLYLQALQKSVVPKARLIALDRLEADLAINEAAKKFEAVPIKNDPPRIVFSTVPAILVYIDGDPAYRPVKGLKLQRVINIRPLILKDTRGKHYLHLLDGWVEASSLTGPWTVCLAPPGDLDKALKDAVAGGQVDLLEGKSDPEQEEEKPTLAKGPVPLVIAATSPTEVIVTEGEAQYVAIPGTSLVYAENTTGHVFKHSEQATSSPSAPATAMRPGWVPSGTARR